MRTDESILGNFLGVRVISQVGESDGGHFLPVTTDDFRECRIVSRFETTDERGVVLRFELSRAGTSSAVGRGAEIE